MKIVFTGTIESVSTRMDKTLKVVIGTQEMDGEAAGKLYSLHQQFAKVLLSTGEITDEEKDLVDSVPVKNEGVKYSNSQRLRFAIYRVHQLQNEPIEFNKFYDREMKDLIIKYENEALEILENNK